MRNLTGIVGMYYGVREAALAFRNITGIVGMDYSVPEA